MTTVKQIERFWNARMYGRLFRELVIARPESSLRLDLDAGRSMPAAAMALIRLEELSQSHVPLYTRLLRALLAGQELDGGWGDVVTTALCLRALLCCQGKGESIEKGMQYLVNLQKSEGIWPLVPIRRMDADEFVSAFVLYELGNNDRFRSAVRFDNAVNWFELHRAALDVETRRLWNSAELRCRIHARGAGRGAVRPTEAMLWS